MENNEYILLKDGSRIPKALVGMIIKAVTKPVGKIIGKAATKRLSKVYGAEAANAIGKLVTRGVTTKGNLLAKNASDLMRKQMLWAINPAEAMITSMNPRFSSGALRWLTTPGKSSFMFAKTPLGKIVGTGILGGEAVAALLNALENPSALNYGLAALPVGFALGGMGAGRFLKGIPGSRKLTTLATIGAPAVALAATRDDQHPYGNLPTIMSAAGIGLLLNPAFRNKLSWSKRLGKAGEAITNEGKYVGEAGAYRLENGEEAVKAWNALQAENRAKAVQEEISRLTTPAEKYEWLRKNNFVMPNDYELNPATGRIELFDEAGNRIPIGSSADFDKMVKQGADGRYVVEVPKIGGKKGETTAIYAMPRPRPYNIENFDLITKRGLTYDYLDANSPYGSDDMNRILEANRRLYESKIAEGWNEAAEKAEHWRNLQRREGAILGGALLGTGWYLGTRTPSQELLTATNEAPAGYHYEVITSPYGYPDQVVLVPNN